RRATGTRAPPARAAPRAPPSPPRVGTPPPPLPDYDPTRTLLWPYVEGNPKVFRCSEGIDRVVGSPTRGRPLQLSYAISGVTGGPAGRLLVEITNGNGTSNVMLVWEHSRAPLCGTNGTDPPGLPPGLPWPLTDADAANPYPG